MTTTHRFSDLTPPQQRALARCHALVVPVGDEQRLKIHDRTLRSLAERRLIEPAQDSRLRTVWQPTERGLALLSTEEPRFLRARGAGDYTSEPGRAVFEPEHGPVEAVGDGDLAVFSERARARDLARGRGVDDALLAEQADLERRVTALRNLAAERGVVARDDLRVAERAIAAAKRRLDEVERRIRTQTEGRAA